ncbi:chymotrypsin-like protease CTRL-1 [Toxorhynchites rutilus septentrionalis]|uniref:chymotrypsin-like protease CTRL-1 n=1 Tax=Toxorhynchites rutilus septentrionalis TaxID=329112 RepID=UPI002478B61D|nr:chymotrypsin-like protease CTRL-1 [Toxorhynchites rutilus septentrionalis]
MYVWFYFGALIVGFMGVVQIKSSISTKNARVPYVVSLETESGQFCSGSIVGTRWILTTADCVWNKLSNELTVGIQPQDGKSSGHHERIQKIYLDPNFVPDSSQGGVALMSLRKPVHWNGRIVTIDVVKNESNSQQSRQCLLIGWNRYQNSSFLAQQMENWPTEKCDDTLRKKLCVEPVNNSLCDYHKGSPLLCQRGDDFEQVGIFSGSQRCSPSYLSAMFINVGDFSEWIDDIIAGRQRPLIKAPNEKEIYAIRLSQFKWLIVAISFFIISVTIFIKVLRSGFKIV